MQAHKHKVCMNVLSYTIVGYEITMGRNLITHFLSGTWYERRRAEFLSIYEKLLKCIKFFSISRLGDDWRGESSEFSLFSTAPSFVA